MPRDERVSVALGEAIAEFSSLEVTLDDALVQLFKLAPRTMARCVGNESGVPMQLSGKIHAFIFACVEMPALRRNGLADGYLNLNMVGYMLDEVFDVRKSIVHGARNFSEYLEHPDQFCITISRWRRDKSGPRAKMRRYTEELGSEYLRDMVERSAVLGQLIHSMLSGLDGSDSMERDRDWLKTLSHRREYWREHEHLFDHIDDPILRSALSGGIA